MVLLWLLVNVVFAQTDCESLKIMYPNANIICDTPTLVEPSIAYPWYPQNSMYPGISISPNHPIAIEREKLQKEIDTQKALLSELEEKER